MKDSWLLYDYLRRWWLLLLIGTALGAVIGIGYYSNQVHPVEYVVTADMVFEDPAYTGDGPIPTVTLAMGPSSLGDGEAAVAHIRTTVAKLASLSDSPVFIRDLSIDRNTTGEPRWKAVVLGSIIGALLVIGGVFVWEDARAYQRRLQVGSTNT
jgi:uncharacterized protein involved in exopolysaccharide biosynthesis